MLSVVIPILDCCYANLFFGHHRMLVNLDTVAVAVGPKRVKDDFFSIDLPLNHHLSRKKKILYNVT